MTLIQLDKVEILRIEDQIKQINKRMAELRHERSLLRRSLGDNIRGLSHEDYAKEHDLMSSEKARDYCWSKGFGFMSRNDLCIEARSGRIKAENYKGRWFFKLEDLQTFLESESAIQYFYGIDDSKD